MTRIIAGVAGGRRISVPAGTGTRPTGDRVREAMFASVEGSAYRSFTGAGQDMNGSIFSGRTHDNRELLLQARIGTGQDKSFC